MRTARQLVNLLAAVGLVACSSGEQPVDGAAPGQDTGAQAPAPTQGSASDVAAATLELKAGKGGTLDVAAAHLELSEGSVTSAASVTLSVLGDTQKAGLAPVSSDVVPVSDWVMVTASVAQLASPAALTLKVNAPQAAGPGSELSVLKLGGPGEKSWKPVPMVALQHAAAAVETPTFGIFGVFRHPGGRFGSLGKLPGWFAPGAFGSGHWAQGAPWPVWGPHGQCQHGQGPGTQLPVCTEDFESLTGCRCQAARTDCDPTAGVAFCVDTLNTNWACGSCDHACDNGTQCSAGQCVPIVCPAGQTLCDNQCVDTATDSFNCGGCGFGVTRYDSPKPRPAQISAVTGELRCDPNVTSMSTLCGEDCVDVTADAQNCGACGQACASDERCDAGTCVAACPAGQTLAVTDNGSYSAIECYTTPQPGTHCAGSGEATNGACVAGQCECEPGMTLCSESGPDSAFKYCADLASDREHCGQCDVNCGVGAQCVQGTCTPIECPEGQILCRDTCVDPNADERACGGCTEWFPVPQVVGGESRVWRHGGGALAADCSSGTCSCDEWSVASSLCVVGEHSSCADFQSDPYNCGGCGTECGVGDTCVSGACVPECGDGLVFVPVEPQVAGLYGSCVNGPVVGDPCAEEATCEAGSCVCPAGQTACENPNDAFQVPAGKHCTDLETSPVHCGACGHTCVAGETCVAGACQVAVCPAGTVPCGYECVDVSTNATHCGGCSSTSGSYAFFFGDDDDSPDCKNPWECECTLPGLPDLCGDHCTDLKRDAGRCGACDVVCADNEACIDGECGAPCPPGQTLCDDGFCVLGDQCGQDCNNTGEQCVDGGCVPIP